jgi:alkylation response protein AidB-like acyl-CoA dehydrogenase
MDVREDVRAWLDENWDPERPAVEWRGILADSGWGCPTWPKEWFGRGLAREAASVVTEEFSKAGAVGPAIGVGMGLAAPTILDHGSDDLRSRLLRRILTGEDTWCQLFSEPGNGSDLAGLTTHAEQAGDEWVVNGQKVWTTGARTAAYGLLVARTDWDVPKHRGITYFVLPMRQDGVEVRPIKQMNGYASFNEVFISDARIPDSNVIGAVNDGWRVALTTLSYERAAAGSLGAWAAVAMGGASGRTAREAAEEAAAYLKTYQWYPQRQGRPDLLFSHARAAGTIDDPVVRQRVAAAWSLHTINRWNEMRARAARRAGRAPGAEGSITKLVLSMISRASADAHNAIAGITGIVMDGALDGTVAEITLSYPAQSIAGGTDEIQRNILGERVLGLPKEPQVDSDVPFREVRRNVR